MASTADDSNLPSLSSPVCHAETTVKATEIGYRNFVLAKICHRQPPHQANTDTTCRQCAVPLYS
jgi:hypothetical protein